jgi:hypothetical protein
LRGQPSTKTLRSLFVVVWAPWHDAGGGRQPDRSDGEVMMFSVVSFVNRKAWQGQVGVTAPD